MPTASESTQALDALGDEVDRLLTERYGAEVEPAAADERAAQAADCEYLLARVRFLAADRERAGCDLRWMSPSGRGSAKHVMRRIRSICESLPDLFSAMAVVVLTHQDVPRQVLAAAVRQFRPDAAKLAQEDALGLLTSIWNGARQSFDAVLRARRSAERRASAVMPLSRNDD